MRAAPGGVTSVESAPGLKGHLFFFIGYLGSSLFGLGAAKVIQAGYIVAVVWVTLFLLGVLLMWVVNLWGRFTVLLIGLVFAVGHYTPMSDQVIAAYAIAWLLLLSGVRLAFAHGSNAADAVKLRDRTAIPRHLGPGVDSRHARSGRHRRPHVGNASLAACRPGGGRRLGQNATRPLHV